MVKLTDVPFTQPKYQLGQLVHVKREAVDTQGVHVNAVDADVCIHAIRILFGHNTDGDITMAYYLVSLGDKPTIYASFGPPAVDADWFLEPQVSERV